MCKDLKGNKKINNSLLGFITTRLHYTNSFCLYQDPVVRVESVNLAYFYLNTVSYSFLIKKST